MPKLIYPITNASFPWCVQESPEELIHGEETMDILDAETQTCPSLSITLDISTLHRI